MKSIKVAIPAGEVTISEVAGGGGLLYVYMGKHYRGQIFNASTGWKFEEQKPFFSPDDHKAILDAAIKHFS